MLSLLLSGSDSETKISQSFNYYFMLIIFSVLPSLSFLVPSSVTLMSFSTFSAAKTRPIIPEPEIHGSHSLDGLTGFLLLMSEGLINALESAHGPEQVNQVSSHPD